MHKMHLLKSLTTADLRGIMERRSLTEAVVTEQFDIKDITKDAFEDGAYIDIPGITLVFDLEGSSASIRQTGAKAFVDTYAEIFDGLTNIIYKNNGIIEKFPGDGISAHFLAETTDLYGEEIGLSFAGINAINAARQIGHHMLIAGYPSSYRISMWSGPDTIATQIGNSFHSEIISIGNGVNMAHKLEKQVKLHGCRIGMDHHLKNTYTSQFPGSSFRSFNLPLNLRSDSDSVWYGI